MNMYLVGEISLQQRVWCNQGSVVAAVMVVMLAMVIMMIDLLGKPFESQFLHS